MMNRIHTSSASASASAVGVMPLESTNNDATIELESIPPEPESSGVSRQESSLGLSPTDSTEFNGSSLPPVDGGFGAWSFVSHCPIQFFGDNAREFIWMTYS